MATDGSSTRPPVESEIKGLAGRRRLKEERLRKEEPLSDVLKRGMKEGGGDGKGGKEEWREATLEADGVFYIDSNE